MKKLLAILLSAGVIISLCACTSENKKLTENDEGLKQIAQKYDNQYQTTANIEYNGTKIKVNMEKTGDGSTKFDFLEPAMLKGMTFEVSKDDIEVGYLGMHFNIDPDNLSSSIIVSTIVSAFNTMASGSGITAEVDGSTLNVIGTTNDANFLLVLDKNSGNALKLEIPSMNLVAEFDSFTLN